MKLPDQTGRLRSTSQRKSRGALFLLAAYLCALAALSVDLVLWAGIPLFAEGPPDFSGLHPHRTGLIGLASALFVLGFSPWGLGRGARRSATGPGDRGGTGAASVAAGMVEPARLPRLGVAHWGILGLVWVSLLLFLLVPNSFLQLQNEDRPVEVGSALFLFGACLIFFRLALQVRKSDDKLSRLYGWAALGLSAAFFLIAMEEVSWFQRVFSLETPAILAESPRDELNLHNLATDPVENAYYGGAFVFLVLLPFVGGRTGLKHRHPFATLFTPSESVLLGAALATAYNFDMWNIFFTQLAFFLTLSILLYLAWEAQRDRLRFVYLVALAATLVLTQTLFLALGDRFVQGWEVTEYKELLIPIAFLLYAGEVYQRVRQIALENRRAGDESSPGLNLEPEAFLESAEPETQKEKA